jgi:hypothetical protein
MRLALERAVSLYEEIEPLRGLSLGYHRSVAALKVLADYAATLEPHSTFGVTIPGPDTLINRAQQRRIP